MNDMEEIINAFVKLDPQKFDLRDQAEMMITIIPFLDFAKKMVAKYSSYTPESTTFLFKMGNAEEGDSNE